MISVNHFLLIVHYYWLQPKIIILPTAYCLLPTAYCLLPTAYCLLPTAYCLLFHNFNFKKFVPVFSSYI
ncbi:MAG: hypothetical protein COB12_06040 [Flavobacterium sp.]|nr:MAG: hypothetical protein COB12_06040 [Flavobacterium sp.]